MGLRASCLLLLIILVAPLRLPLISGASFFVCCPEHPDRIIKLKTCSGVILILPDKMLKFAGGREKALGSDEYRGYAAGINSTLVGNYLTTLKSAKKELISYSNE